MKGSWHGAAVTEGFHSRYFLQRMDPCGNLPVFYPPGLAMPNHPPLARGALGCASTTSAVTIPGGSGKERFVESHRAKLTAAARRPEGTRGNLPLANCEVRRFWLVRNGGAVYWGFRVTGAAGRDSLQFAFGKLRCSALLVGVKRMEPFIGAFGLRGPPEGTRCNLPLANCEVRRRPAGAAHSPPDCGI